MPAKKHKSIEELFADGEMIDRVLDEGVRNAVRFHKAMGNPVAARKKGKVIWVSPEKIKLTAARTAKAKR